jgi:hypothetical protein
MEEFVLAHEPDVAWLIALWIAINGGDPPPEGPIEVEETTALLAAALSARLGELYGAGAATAEALQDRLTGTGIAVRTDDASSFEPFHPEGKSFCINLPSQGTGTNRVAAKHYCWYIPQRVPFPPTPGR